MVDVTMVSTCNWDGGHKKCNSNLEGNPLFGREEDEKITL
jgi:hypothetical protein